MTTLHLTVNHGTHSSGSATACEQYIWHDSTYTASGIYAYTYINVDGCLSTDTLHLTISPQEDSAYYITVCDNYTWNGTAYTVSGVYVYEHSQPSSTCENVDTLYLTINHSSHYVLDTTTCDLYDWNGVAYSATGLYTYNYTNADGCTSVDTLRLTINYSDSIIEELNACDSLIWHGVTYYASTDSVTYTTVNRMGCDSVTTLHLDIDYGSFDVWTDVGTESYVWHDSVYMVSGLYIWTYYNVYGCRSVDTLHLTVRHASHLSTTDSACDNYLWHDSSYVSSGTYEYHYINGDGVASCDTLHLTILPSVYTVCDTSSCDSFFWQPKGMWYTTSATDTLRFASAHGCDSIVVLSLTLYNSSVSDVAIHACDSFLWEESGRCYRSDTAVSVHRTTSHGCDSIMTLHLNLDTSSPNHIDTVACGSFRWDVTDSLYRQSTQQTVRLTTYAGCDSLLTLQLTIYAVDSTHLWDTVCDGNATLWHGQLCDHTGQYLFDTLNRHGCDSTVIMHLTMVEPPSVVASATYDCQEEGYRLVANTSAHYVEWSAWPADSAGLSQSWQDAFAQPQTTVAYTVCADWRDTLFCPACDTIVLQPALLPTATLTTYPDVLTADNLTLRAEAHPLHAQRLEWWVNRRYYAENCMAITYTAEEQADSVWLAVVVENELCADTITTSVAILHDALHVPNIFLPESGDEELGQFRVRSSAITDFEMEIYNRSGERVFHVTDIDIPWDGTCAGSPCPQGTYVYHIRYRVPKLSLGWQSKTGTVTLVR